MLKKYLQLMGFNQIPQMKELRKRFLQLSVECHPDKGGSDKKFQELLDAHNFISKFIIENVPADLNDNEKTIARK